MKKRNYLFIEYWEIEGFIFSIIWSDVLPKVELSPHGLVTVCRDNMNSSFEAVTESQIFFLSMPFWSIATTVKGEQRLFS